MVGRSAGGFDAAKCIRRNAAQRGENGLDAAALHRLPRAGRSLPHAAARRAARYQVGFGPESICQQQWAVSETDGRSTGGHIDGRIIVR